MRPNTFIAAVASLCLAESTHAINIISSNDDGWAEVNIRALYQSLNSAGHLTVVSAPAENESGTGSRTICVNDFAPRLTRSLMI